jgi:hypothetical protein
MGHAGHPIENSSELRAKIEALCRAGSPAGLRCLGAARGHQDVLHALVRQLGAVCSDGI